MTCFKSNFARIFLVCLFLLQLCQIQPFQPRFRQVSAYTSPLLTPTSEISPCVSFPGSIPRNGHDLQMATDNSRIPIDQILSDEGNTNVNSNVQADITKSILWASAATGFAALIAVFKSSESAIEFASGYLLELCLSVDNLFVFLFLFGYFGIKKVYQERVLRYGIIGAVILRGLFIWLGALAISQSHQIFFVFALILGYTSLTTLFSNEEEKESEGGAEEEDNWVVNITKKFLPTTNKFADDKFFIIEEGKRLATPLFLCLLCIEISDIVFAFDSVPAIFGVTNDPFIVYSSNIFAIAGLRALYGALAKAVDELKYLDKAVAVVLGVIAVKLGYEAMDIEILTPLQSLLMVLGVLGIGTVASLVSPRDETNKQQETTNEQQATNVTSNNRIKTEVDR